MTPLVKAGGCGDGDDQGKGGEGDEGRLRTRGVFTINLTRECTRIRRPPRAVEAERIKSRRAEKEVKQNHHGILETGS